MTEQGRPDPATPDPDRQRRRVERATHPITEFAPRTLPLAVLGWTGLLTFLASIFFLLALGSSGGWSLLSLGFSLVLAVVLLAVAGQRQGARFGMPLQSGVNNGLATNLAVALTVLQLLANIAGFTKEVAATGHSNASTPTTIINQRICPETQDFKGFDSADERS